MSNGVLNEMPKDIASLGEARDAPNALSKETSESA